MEKTIALFENTLHTHVQYYMYGSSQNAAEDISAILRSRYGKQCPYTPEAIAQMELGELALIIREYLMSKADTRFILSEHRDGVVLLRIFLGLLQQIEDYVNEEAYQNSFFPTPINLYYPVMCHEAGSFTCTQIARMCSELVADPNAYIRQDSTFGYAVFELNELLHAPEYYDSAITAIGDLIILPWSMYMERVEGVSIETVRSKANRIRRVLERLVQA